MGYTSRDEVKALLRLTGTTNDNEVDAAIVDFERRIDNKCKPHTSVPLNPVPDIIKSVSKFGSAALWCRLFPEGKTFKEFADVWEKLADQWLDEYLNETFYKPKIK